MQVTIIAAVAENGAIGKDNDLLWHLPRDMRFFKETTSGHYVIMGRKNYYSIPEKYRPLPNRTNIVVSRRTDLTLDGVQIFSSMEKALDFAELEDQKEVFIIGGGQVYTYALENKLVSRMLITHVSGNFEADVFFPKIDTDNWKAKLILDHPADGKDPLDFTIVEYLPA
ncbi:MAG: dihydrofolate reductase [Flavobacteriales bacterium]|nr:dihydrofolate reductase [Flavobacteriales bacterium]